MRGKHGGGEVGKRNYHARLTPFSVLTTGYRYTYFLLGGDFHLAILFGDILNSVRLDALRPTHIRVGAHESVRQRNVGGGTVGVVVTRSVRPNPYDHLSGVAQFHFSQPQHFLKLIRICFPEGSPG